MGRSTGRVGDLVAAVRPGVARPPHSTPAKDLWTTGCAAGSRPDSDPKLSRRSIAPAALSAKSLPMLTDFDFGFDFGFELERK